MEDIISVPQPSLFPSLTSPNQLPIPQDPPASRPQCPQPPVTPLPFPIPPFLPFIPPVPPRLPNGTIPIPPPGWIPPPGRHRSIPIPPPHILPIPSIPPQPPFLRPPPPLIVSSSVPPPSQLFPLPVQPPGSLDKVNHARDDSAPLPLHRPPWPVPPLPRFNPFVPPPGYPVKKENPHKVTVEKVLEAIIDELKVIIRKDITRRMVEGIAFRAFEDWCECQERKTKVGWTLVFFDCVQKYHIFCILLIWMHLLLFIFIFYW